MTKSLPARRTGSNVQPAPPTRHRLACAMVRETRAELTLFVARMPQFRDEVDAMPGDEHGFKDGDDIGQVEYDFAGLAELLGLVGEKLPTDGTGVRVYRPIAAPAAYCDALALVVARVDALRERLESLLSDGDEWRQVGQLGGDAGRPWLRAAAWAAWQAVSGNVGSVRFDRKEFAEATLADALTAEASVAEWGDGCEVDGDDTTGRPPHRDDTSR